MNCEICSLDSSVDSVMWTCTGCPRRFHPACVGVPVQRNSLRKKDKKVVDVTSYVLPCCSSCQSLIRNNFEFNELVQQQALLADQINKNTEVTHRSTLLQEKPGIVHEGFDRLENLLEEIKIELTAANKGTDSTDGGVAIMGHINSLFDKAMQSSKDSISMSMEKMTSDIANDLKCIYSEVNELRSLSLDMAATAAMQNNPMLGLDILDELKSLSANLIAFESNVKNRANESEFDSLENELHNTHHQQATDTSGWRLLGTRKVWKADWTEYDARKLRRLNQQKLTEKARKRKRSARNNNNNNKNIRNSILKTRQNNNSNLNNHNNSHSNNHYNNNMSNLNHGKSGNNFLPPDRVLLAAAKDRFSRPPTTTYRPTIQFHRGETLNPYPVNDDFPRSFTVNSPNRMAPGCSSTASCACFSQHSCFQHNGHTL